MSETPHPQDTPDPSVATPSAAVVGVAPAVVVPAAVHAVGARLGRYTLVQRLAKGGFGEVYLAFYPGAGGEPRHCVVKTLLSELVTDREATERFVEEARVLVSLSHPNIVQILEFGRAAEQFFIAMEYVEGVSLSLLLAKQGALPVPVALFVAQQMLSGLDYAHTQRDLTGRCYEMVHRDISPANVLISRQGEVKLADFGLARRRTSRRVTDDGVVIGKLAYLAPELLERAPASVRSDLYAVGVCLHEMLTGQRLLKIEGQGLKAVQDQLARGFDPPSRLRPGLSPHLDQICLQALARQPAERLLDASVMAGEIELEMAGLGSPDARSALAQLAEDVHALRPLVNWAELIGALPPEPGDVAGDAHPASRSSDRLAVGSLSDVHRVNADPGDGTVRFEMILNETRAFGPAGGTAGTDSPAAAVPAVAARSTVEPDPLPAITPAPQHPVDRATDVDLPALRRGGGESWRLVVAVVGAGLFLLLGLLAWWWMR